MDTNKAIENTVALLQELRTNHLECEELGVLYTTMYIALRVITTEDPTLMKQFLDMLVNFVKEEIDKDNISVM